MDYKLKVAELFTKHFDTYLRDRFSSSDLLKQINEVRSIVNDTSEVSKQLQNFMATMITSIVDKVVTDKYEEVIQKIHDEVYNLVKDLLTTEEAQQVCEWATSPVMQKMLRNIDLIGEACQEGTKIMSVELGKRMSSEKVNQQVEEFMQKLIEDEFGTEFENE